MSDIDIRQQGCAGRITLTRPKALNALTHEMCLEMEAALDRWRDDDAITVILIDAEGERAFCSGGDIAELYACGKRGDFDYGRKFWTDEYRLNRKIFTYPKPIVSFLHGFTMGGGVGIGCHGSHRIVAENSQLAMPEVGIGLIPDVGGSLLLALAPGRLGEYLSLTAARMGPDDAIYAGFADSYVAQAKWGDLIAELETSGDVTAIDRYQTTPEQGRLRTQQAEIDALFAGEAFDDIKRALAHSDSEFAVTTSKKIANHAPLSMACAVEILHRLRGPSLTMEKALDFEYRFTARASEHGDLLEGVRAAIIDKDRAPKWQYAQGDVPAVAVSKMLMPLGKDALKL